jgi:hypothetical protein
VIILTKLSSNRIIPADSLATSVPAIPKILFKQKYLNINHVSLN